jgi:hypothetical protein
MSKTGRCILLSVVAILLFVGPTLAVDSSRLQQVRVIHGVFAAETGQKVEFRVPEGGTMVIKNKNVTYHLVPTILSDDRVQLKIVNPGLASAKAREIAVFDIEVGGQMTANPLVPFSLGVTSVKPEKMLRAPVMEKEAAIGGSGCCIVCGGWQVCCYPASGWCCTLDSSCGNSCGACNLAQ